MNLGKGNLHEFVALEVIASDQTLGDDLSKAWEKLQGSGRGTKDKFGRENAC